MGDDNNNASSVCVAVRFRPLNAREAEDRECVVVDADNNKVTLNDKIFTFDHCFNPATKQAEVFNQVVVPLLDSFFKGYNATILAYGQTGSGKTHTMGTAHSPVAGGSGGESVGIVSRVIQNIFGYIQKFESTKQITVKATFIELYNEEIRDLLGSSTSNRVSVREEKGEGMVLVGATEKPALAPTELASALDFGSVNRVTHSTEMNSTSSRSHAIFTIHLEQKAIEDPNAEKNEGDELLSDFTASKFHFVDLAGSERIKRTGAEGDRMKEGISINSGLLALGNVISALGDTAKQNQHVPYRDSKLTRLLQDSLGGNSKTAMIACASPADSSFFETLSTLRYANRARNIQNKPVINRDPFNALVRTLRAEIQQLKEQLALHKNPNNNKQTTTTTSPPNLGQTLTPRQQEKIKQLEDSMEELREESKVLEFELSREKERVRGLSVSLEMGKREAEVLKSRLTDKGGDPVVVLDHFHSAEIPLMTDEISKMNTELRESNKLVAMLSHKLSVTEKVLTKRQKQRIHDKLQQESPPGTPVSLDKQASREKLMAPSEMNRKHSARLLTIFKKKKDVFREPTRPDLTSNAEAALSNRETEDPDDDGESDDEFVRQQEQDQHDSATKLLEGHYDALTDGIHLKEGLVAHVNNKAENYKKLEDDIDVQIVNTQAAIQATQQEIKETDAKLKQQEGEDNAELSRMKDEQREALAKLQKQLTVVTKEKKKIEKLKETSDRKASALQREVALMKRERAELAKKMQEEAREWKRYKEEQMELVFQLKQKLDQSEKIAHEEKNAKIEVQKELEETKVQVGTLQREIKQATMTRTRKVTATTKTISQAVTLWRSFLVEGLDRVVELRLAHSYVEKEKLQVVALERKLGALKTALAASAKEGYEVQEDTFEQLDFIQEEISYRKAKVDKQLQVLRAFEQSAPSVPVSIESLNLPDSRSICTLLFESYLQERVARESDANEIGKLNEDFAKAQDELQQLKMGKPMERMLFEEEKIQLQKEHEQQLWFFMSKVEQLKNHVVAMQRAQPQLDPHDQNTKTVVKSLLEANPEIWNDLDDAHELRERKFEEVQLTNEKLSDQVSLLSQQLVERGKDLMILRRVGDMLAAIDVETRKNSQQFPTVGIQSSDGKNLTSGSLSFAQARKERQSVSSVLDAHFDDANESAVVQSPGLSLPKPKPQQSGNVRKRTSSGNVFQRLADPANFPEGKQTAKSREKKGRSLRNRAEERRQRDTSVKLKHSFERVAVLKGHGGAVTGIATHNNIAFSSSGDKSIKVWDLRTQAMLATMEGHGSIVRTVAWSDQHGILISGSLDKSVRLWDVRQNRATHILKHRGLAELCTIVPDGDTFFTGSEDSAIRLWDIRKIAPNEPVNVIHTLQGHTGSVFAILKTDANIYSGSRDHTLKVWNSQSLKCSSDLTHHFDSITSLLWLRGCLVSGSRDKSIKYYLEGTGQQPYSIDPTSYPNNAHSDFVLSLLTTADETVMLSSSKDGKIKLWDTDELKCGGTMKVHSGAVNQIKWAMGDKLLLSASQDRTVNLYKHVISE